MILILSDEHKQHLQFLQQTTSDVSKEFLRIAVEFLVKGSNPKIYQSAAQKLEVGVDMVQHTVEGLMYLLTESTKMMLSELEFQDSILNVGLGEEMQGELLACYVNNRQQIRQFIGRSALHTTHFRDLEWRLDLQLASRSLRRQLTPLVKLKLTLDRDGDRKDVVLQTDPTNLVHMTVVLEQALKEAQSQHARRLTRHIK